MTNRRKDARQPLDYPCWFAAGVNQSPNEGRLCDVSKSGAKLICEDPVQVPNEFNLYLTRDGTVGRKCRVVRRDGNEIGLHFLRQNVPKPQWPELSAVAPVVEV